MAHGVQDFYAAAQAGEFARDFQFRVISLGPFEESDLIYITTATLPGKDINNQKVPYMGLDFNVPGSVSYVGSDAWELNFRCDEGLNIRNRMEAYMSEVFDIETGGTGKYGVPTQVGTMELLGKNFEAIRKYDFIGIYPKTLGPLAYDIQGTGTPLTFPCTFAYQFWRQVE